jgi:hypothetical protein
MIQIILNHDWDWATEEQRIWFFRPVESIDDAQIQLASIILSGGATIAQAGLACPLTTKPIGQTSLFN